MEDHGMSTIVFGSGFRAPREDGPGPSGKFWILLARDPYDNSGQALYRCWAPTREALERLAAVRRWEDYDLLEMDAEPEVPPAESPREVCITNLRPLIPRRRRRGPDTARDYRGELVERYATMGELADAGEWALFELEFPADLIDDVDAQLARFGLELAPADDAEAA
jgi:hypothetical protein